MNMKEFKKRLNDNRGKNLKGEKVKDNNDFMLIDLGGEMLLRLSLI